MHGATLEITKLTCRFGGVAALDGVSVDVARGAALGVIGPNGAGKSTFLSVLGGQTRQRSGTIKLEGEPIERLLAHQRFDRGLVRTFQLPRPFPRLTVRENLMLVPPPHGSRDAAAAQAEAALRDLNLLRLADRPASELSGGQQKLLDIARAMMAQPRVLLLDEPCAGVTPALIEVMSATLDRLRAQGVTLLVVEHHIEFLAQHCDEILVLVQGAVMTRGTPDAVRGDPAVQEAFLGVVYG